MVKKRNAIRNILATVFCLLITFFAIVCRQPYVFRPPFAVYLLSAVLLFLVPAPSRAGLNWLLTEGGTITTSGLYRVHTFTSNGTFQVLAGGGDVEVLVVAGGGGGGGYNIDAGGGGGAGGLIYTSVVLSAQSYPVIVGQGGSYATELAWGAGSNGFDSAFGTITAKGGGGGGTGKVYTDPVEDPRENGRDGGSGGGACNGDGIPGNGTIGQGHAGGYGGGSAGSTEISGGGGGGAGGPGVDGTEDIGGGLAGGGGGAGVTISISGSAKVYAGGGGGGTGRTWQPAGAGGIGGGGNGGARDQNGTDGVANTGSGGAGGGGGSGDVVGGHHGGRGGSGIVIVRYSHFPFFSGPPAWWYAQGAVDTNLPANDFAPITLGQLKWLALNAYYEMDANFDAGPEVAQVVNAFGNAGNYTLASIGQVKYVAQPFYDRLYELNLTNTFPPNMPGYYPWGHAQRLAGHAPQTNDFAPALIGQAKYVFSFYSAVDSDADGLSDWDEAGRGTNPYDPDSDDDGLSDGWEVEHGTNPLNWDTDGDGLSDAWEVAHGKNPLDPNDAEPELTNMRENARLNIVYYWRLYYGSTLVFTNPPGSAADLLDLNIALNALSDKFYKVE